MTTMAIDTAHFYFRHLDQDFMTDKTFQELYGLPEFVQERTPYAVMCVESGSESYVFVVDASDWLSSMRLLFKEEDGAYGPFHTFHRDAQRLAEAGCIPEPFFGPERQDFSQAIALRLYSMAKAGNDRALVLFLHAVTHVGTYVDFSWSFADVRNGVLRRFQD